MLMGKLNCFSDSILMNILLIFMIDGNNLINWHKLTPFNLSFYGIYTNVDTFFANQIY